MVECIYMPITTTIVLFKYAEPTSSSYVMIVVCFWYQTRNFKVMEPKYVDQVKEPHIFQARAFRLKLTIYIFVSVAFEAKVTNDVD